MKNNGYAVGGNDIGTVDSGPIGVCSWGGGDCVEVVGNDMMGLMFFSDGIPEEYCRPFKVESEFVD
jgi:hypothetical protein